MTLLPIPETECKTQNLSIPQTSIILAPQNATKLSHPSTKVEGRTFSNHDF